MVDDAAEWLTTRDVAQLLRKPESWVFNNAGPLRIPRVRLGKHYRYSRTALAEWLDQQQQRSA